jgi:predicted acylesterase/phospholipase RssA
MSDPQPLPAPPPAAGTGPLGELALSFSGGGYRAAAFHLGALRLLQRTDLLRDVVALSTVSGGSIVGAAWVLSVLRGQPFGDFDRRFAEFLQKTNVIRDALDNLTEHRKHGRPSYPSLIRSAARIYARPDLFGDTRLGDIDLSAQAAGGDRPRFREVIFNSTEFRTGVDFRFRRSVNPRAAVGNGYFRVPREVAGRIRVADAVAASSCFPGGFEPLLFPEHFDWPASFPLEKAEEALGPKFDGGLPLMDGGIWDNQGVDSLVLAFERGGAATLVISDVAARNRDIYDFPPAGRRGFVTLRTVSILGWLLFLAAVLSAGLLAWTGIDEWAQGERGWMQVFLYAVPFAFSAAVAVALGWLRITLDRVQKRLKATIRIPDIWKDLHKLTVLEAIGMVELRVGSLLALTSSIFMKRIRGLIVSSVYKDPAYEGKRMMNLVYSLDENRPKLYEAYPWLEPSPALRKLATDAEAFPTTLWFDDPKQMEMVARAGEVTLCFILLQFIVEQRAKELANPASPVSGLFARLRQEWDVFNGAAAARGSAVPAAKAGVAGG